MKEFPILSLTSKEQENLLKKLKTEINKQNEIKSKIAELRGEIDKLIYEEVKR